MIRISAVNARNPNVLKMMDTRVFSPYVLCPLWTSDQTDSIKKRLDGSTYAKPRNPMVASIRIGSPAGCKIYAAMNRSMLGGTTSSAAMTKAPPVMRTVKGFNIGPFKLSRIIELTQGEYEKEQPSRIAPESITVNQGQGENRQRNMKCNLSSSYLPSNIQRGHVENVSVVGRSGS
jgi:hypothetical protein